MTLLTALAGLLSSSPALAYNVAVITDAEEDHATALADGILAAGAFDAVHIYTDVPGTLTPDLYAAVMVFDGKMSDYDLSSIEVGYKLAQYLEDGGGLIVAPYSYCGWDRGDYLSGGLTGDIIDDALLPFYCDSSDTGTNFGPYEATMVVNSTGHDIVTGVTDFVPGQRRYNNIMMDSEATLIASYSDGEPLISTWNPPVGFSEASGEYDLYYGTVVGLNFYPIENIYEGESWYGPDGYTLIANAITYAAECGDSDRDGYNTCGALPDCDDLDPTVNPGEDDIEDDGIDQDCDGEDALSETDPGDDTGNTNDTGDDGSGDDGSGDDDTGDDDTGDDGSTDLVPRDGKLTVSGASCSHSGSSAPSGILGLMILSLSLVVRRKS